MKKKKKKDTIKKVIAARVSGLNATGYQDFDSSVLLGMGNPVLARSKSPTGCETYPSSFLLAFPKSKRMKHRF
jgi:hypothetical protein